METKWRQGSRYLGQAENADSSRRRGSHITIHPPNCCSPDYADALALTYAKPRPKADILFIDIGDDEDNSGDPFLSNSGWIPVGNLRATQELKASV